MAGPLDDDDYELLLCGSPLISDEEEAATTLQNAWRARCIRKAVEAAKRAAALRILKALREFCEHRRNANVTNCSDSSPTPQKR